MHRLGNCQLDAKKKNWKSQQTLRENGEVDGAKLKVGRASAPPTG